MQPQARQLVGVVELLWGGHEQALEHICQMPDGELVMEVNSRLAEGAGNLVMERQGSLQDLGPKLLLMHVRLNYINRPGLHAAEARC